MFFDPDRYHRPDDPALAVIASRQTLTRWRHEGQGPPYRKVDNRIPHTGKALNEWLADCTVRPLEEAGRVADVTGPS